MLESFALMMILQMKPDRSHPHEIIFKSTLSRVEFWRTAGRPTNRIQVEGLGHSAVEGRSISASTAPQTSRDSTGKMFRQKFFHNLSPAVSVFGRKFVSCARRCQKTHSSSRFGEKLLECTKTTEEKYTKSLLRARSATSARWTEGVKTISVQIWTFCAFATIKRDVSDRGRHLLCNLLDK